MTDLSTIKAALAKATEAPWHAATKPHPVAIKNKTEAAGVYGPDCLIYHVSRDYVCLPETWEQQKADAELIVLLRNSAPALIAEVERLRQQERKGAHVVEAIAFAYEGKDVAEGLRAHGLVQRALRFKAATDSEIERLRESERWWINNAETIARNSDLRLERAEQAEATRDRAGRGTTWERGDAMTKTVKAWLVLNDEGTPIDLWRLRRLAEYARDRAAHEQVVRATITYEVPEPAKKGKKR